MRVVVLIDDPGIAYGAAKGAAVHVAELTRALADAGTAVLVLVTGIDHAAPAPPPGVLLDVLPGPGKGAATSERLAAGPARTAWVAARARQWGADAIYERVALHTTVGVDVASALGIPHLAELNAPLLEEAARYRSLDDAAGADAREARVLSGSDAVLAVSPPLSRHAVSRGARRVEVCPNAVHADRFDRPAQADLDPARVIFIGRLRPWHGAETLAEAWELLGPEAPSLLVVGDGDGRDRLEAAGAEVTGTVAFDRVSDLLTNAQIGVVPYPSDTPVYFSPLKLFEYLAAGLAVVAADLPGVRDVVGDAAVLVPPGDAVALADAIASLVRDPERRARLGAAGREAVLADHTWSHRARRVLELVAELRDASAVRCR